MTDALGVERLAADIMDEFGRIDILVNNAGIFLDRNPGMSVSAAQLRQTYETNVIAPIKLMQTVIPHMRQRGYGRIVNVSSRMGIADTYGRWFTGIPLIEECAERCNESIFGRNSR